MLDQPDDSVDPRQWLLRMAGQTPMTAGAPPISASPTAAPSSAPPAAMAGQGQQRPAMVAPPIGGTQADQAQLAQLKEQGSGVSRLQANHPFVGGIARVGDVLGSIFAPHATAMIPGTTLNHERQLGQQQQMVNQDLAGEKEQAQVADLNAKPELAQAKNELATEKMHSADLLGHENLALKQQHEHDMAEQHAEALAGQLRKIGYKEDPATRELKPLDYAEMSPPQKAFQDLQAARKEQADAMAEYRKAQTSAIPMQMHQAQQRIANAQQNSSIAERRLALSQKQFELGAYGTVGGEQPAGGLQTDQGTPVGTKFQQNVRPTGQERNKADMANSAHDQISDMKSIISKRPDVFGPVAGRVTDFKVWLGSQDPDAQRFRAARTIAGDHLAGTFGGRSEAALNALDSAIGHFKDNPAAVEAGLNQLDKANQRFREAGTVHTAGSSASHTQGQQQPAAASGGTIRYSANGKTYNIPAEKEKDFLKAFPNAAKR